MKVNNATSFFIVLAFLGLVITFLGPFVLPERYFLDANYYLYDRYNIAGWVGSYPVTIMFYKITGLRNLPLSLISVIQYSILVFLLYKIGVPKDFHKPNFKNIVLYLFIFVLAIYLSAPTKEFINYVFIFLVVTLFQKKKYNLKTTVVIGLVMFILFGLWFRVYFMLIPIISIAIYLIRKVKIEQKTYNLIFYSVIIVIFLSLASGAVQGEFMSQSTREKLNVQRMGKANANSMIVSPVATDTWYGESFGVVYGFFSVNLPFHELVRHYKSPQIVVFIIWQILLLLIIALSFDKCVKNKEKYSYQIWLFYFLFAYLAIQGVFEPDLGSAVRHKAGMLPLIYICLNYDKIKNYRTD